MHAIVALALLLLLSGCAPTQEKPPHEIVRLSPAPASAFPVDPASLSQAPETRRWKVSAGDLLATDESVILEETKPFVRASKPVPRADRRLAASREGGRPGQLAGALRRFVGPGTWENGVATSLSVEKDELVARHAPDVLAQLDRAIDTLRTRRDRAIDIRIRLFTPSKQELSRLESLAPASGGLAGTFERDALVKWEGSHERPWRREMTLLHGQAAQVLLQNPIAYVAGYHEERAPNARVFDPVVSTFVHGCEIRIRAIANGPRPDEFLVDLSIEGSALRDLVEAGVAAGRIEIPLHAEYGISGTFPLRSGQALLVVMPNAADTLRPFVAAVIEASWSK